MKIGIITERMINGFGVDLVVHKTAEDLGKNGHEVTIYAIREDGSFPNSKYYKIKLIPSPLFFNPIKTEIYAIKRLIKLNNEDVDVWLVETFPFFIAPYILKRPVIIVNHGIVPTMGMSLKEKCVFTYMKLMNKLFYFPRAKRIITTSKYLKSTEPFVKRMTDIVPLGIDHIKVKVTDMDKDEIRRKYKVKKDELLMFSISRLNYERQPYKGIDDAIDIYEDLKSKNRNLKYIIAGFGEEKDKEFLNSKGIDAYICIPEEDKIKLLAAADIFISPSKWEGFGMPILEAQYQGTPTVAYKVTGHAETSIDGKHGFLVKSKKQFSDAIQKLIDDIHLRKKLGKQAKVNANRYKWSKLVKRYEEIIKENITTIDQDYKKNQVDIIILNFNGKKHLRKLFDSIKKQTYKNINTIMVDNGSSDGSADYVKSRFPWVKVVISNKNLFFSKGNNLAVRETSGEYILFLNNDLILESDTVQEAVDSFRRNYDKDCKVAGLALKMYLRGFPGFLDSIGSVITDKCSPFNIGIGEYDIGQYNKEKKVFGACFGAVFLKRRLYEGVIGKLDDDYYGYFEDVDWCYRAQLLGYHIISAYKSQVYHEHSSTSRKRPPDWKYFLIHRNYLRTVEKNCSKRSFVLVTIEKLVSELKRFIFRRQLVSLKVFFAYLIGFPKFFTKRLKLQIRRVRNDPEIFSYSDGLQPFFDTMKYKPKLDLENLWCIFLNFHLNISEEFDSVLFEIFKLRLVQEELSEDEMIRNVNKFMENIEGMPVDVRNKYKEGIIDSHRKLLEDVKKRKTFN